VDIGKFASSRTKFMRASEIRELLKWITGDVISLGGGMPDPSVFPVPEIKDIVNDVLSEMAHKALQYGSTEGVYELRSEIAKFVGADGIKATPENVIVTTGSQEALELIARVFLDSGDVVITENPTYLAALQAFRVYNPRIVGVPMDEHGMKTEVLDELIKKLIDGGNRVKLIYTVPTCQNPTGITMSLERRKHLVEIAERYDILIVEDNPYSYFMFEEIPYRHLKALDRDGRVIYVSTASKILAPGLRIGWAVAEEEIVRMLALAKQAIDLHSPTFSQYILLEALRRNVVVKHLPRIRDLYRRKRDVMLKALETYMPQGTSWSKPIGGMFVWLIAPEKIDMGALLLEAIRKYKVAYVPGRSFHVDDSGSNTARLNFTYPTFEQIDLAIARLAALIRENL